MYRMKKTNLLLTSTVLAILSSALHGQTTVFLEVDGDWNVADNWTNGIPGTDPTGNYTAIINNSRTANITSNTLPFETFLRVGNQNDPNFFGALNIGADLAVNNIQIASGPNSTGFVTQTAGTVTVGNNLQIASNNAGATAEYTISGGTLAGPSANIAVGTMANGLFHVSGDSASISANAMNIGATATLRFTLAEAGVTPIAINEGVTITDGATLIVDGAAFTGSLGSITLLQATGITGGFGDNVTFENFGALTPELSQVGGSLMVIPEPRVYGLALGLLAFAGIVLRRLRTRA